MKGKPKALLVTSRLPFPRDSGFAHKNFHLISTLVETYSVTLLVIDRNHPEADDIRRTEELVDTLYFLESPKGFALIYELLRCFLLGFPLQFGFFNSFALRQKFLEQSERASIVVGSVARIWPTIMSFSGKILVDAADSLSVIFNNNAINHSTFFGRLYYRYESIWIKGVERSMVAKSCAVCVFNPEEAKFLRGYGPSVKVVPHGVGDAFLKSSLALSIREYRNDVVIFGKMNFLPNVDAVIWFAENVLPLLPAPIRLVALGATPSDKLLELSRTNPRIIVTGFVEDPAPILASALASIAPVKLGGGIQNKVIESLAAGARVLVSEQVMRSMPNFEESGAVVCSSAQEWHDKILTLYTEGSSYRRDFSSGKDYVRKHFSWMAYKEALRGILSEIRLEK